MDAGIQRPWMAIYPYTQTPNQVFTYRPVTIHGQARHPCRNDEVFHLLLGQNENCCANLSGKALSQKTKWLSQLGRVAAAEFSRGF